MSLTRLKLPDPNSRMSIIHAMPCVACVIEKVEQPSPTTAHHIVAQSYRRLSGGHDSSLPLCRHHHLGEPRPGFTKTEMAAIYGPSLAENKREFVRRYGTERALLAMVDSDICGKKL